MQQPLMNPNNDIQNNPDQTHPIRGVPTAVCAFVGRAIRGPVNKFVPIDSFADFQKTFGGLWEMSELGYAVQQFFWNGGKEALVVRAISQAALRKFNEAPPWIDLPGPAGALRIVPKNPGSWFTNKGKVTLTVGYNWPRELGEFHLEFTLTEIDPKTGEAKITTESFDVSVKSDSPNYIVTELEKKSNCLRAFGTIPVEPPTPSWMGGDYTFAANVHGESSDGSALVEADLVDSSLYADKQGIYALEDADTFTLMVLPPHSPGEEAAQIDLDPTGAIWKKALEYCKSRRAMLLIDPPSDWKSKEEASSALKGSPRPPSVVRDPNSAMYFPWIYFNDPLRNGRRAFAPSGAVAGAISKSDSARGVCRAPAGKRVTIQESQGLVCELNPKDSKDLNVLGLNCLRTFPNMKPVVWGARTLDGAGDQAPERKWLAIRRTLLFIEESIYQGTKWATFEINDKSLWSEIEESVKTFMNSLCQDYALQSVSPQKPTFVKCSRKTTRKKDVSNGIVNIEVGFVPVTSKNIVTVKISQNAGNALPLERVLEAEHKEIDKIRQRRKEVAEEFTFGNSPRLPVTPPASPVPGRASALAGKPKWQTRERDWVRVTKDAHDKNLVGLAFSGGGIRSATFNLGVLQALADLKLLYRIDYLSTVSGGGYIGGWLAAWTKRLGSFAETQHQLAPNRVHQQEDREPTPIRFLRMFSNYLTPTLGIFSGDTWAMVGIYLRNLLLNLVIVLAMVTTALLLPRLLDMADSARELGYVAGELSYAAGVRTGVSDYLPWVAALCVLFAIVIIWVNMAYMESARDKKRTQQTIQDQENQEQPNQVRPWWDKWRQRLSKQGWILVAACALFVAAVLVTVWQGVNYYTDYTLPMIKAVWGGAVAYGLFWSMPTPVDWIIRKTSKSKMKQKEPVHDGQQSGGEQEPHRVRNFVIETGAAAAAGAFAGWFYALLSRYMLYWLGNLTTGVPIVVGVFLLAGTLHIGLMGVVFRDWKREWWGRFGGWLLLWSLAWVLLFWVALYLPGFIGTNPWVSKTWEAIAAKWLTPVWIISSVGGVLAGKYSTPESRAWVHSVAKIGPYVFMAGLLGWVSYVIAMTVIGKHPILSFIGCVVVGGLMAWRVDINQFSMHDFYRNRLVRCYLGASNETRTPNRFTGFEPSDDVPLKDLRPNAHKNDDKSKGYDGPFPLFNTSLNLVKGKDLAWQERKAESFVMTPLYCGYDVWLEEQDSPILRNQRSMASQAPKHSAKAKGQYRPKLPQYGYRTTKDYAFSSHRRRGHGPDLGLAMAISGAAVSPNMGFHSSAPVAFLLTVFDVRLGQWLGNPRHRETWQKPTPLFSLPYLLKELLGAADDEAGYVYLSDGGHFDNMGLYELVKRRCGLIILCDVEADNEYGFAGLVNAIRKCRIDLGIDITLDVHEIIPQKKGGPSRAHCAIGEIHYENTDVQAPTGSIIYFKASLTGDEFTNVADYKKKHGTFPHESTVDQWFSESQFESYRHLGYHEVITTILGRPCRAPKPAATKTPSQSPEATQSAESSKDKEEAEVSKPSPLPKRLKAIFDKFGFDTSELPRFENPQTK